MTTRSTRVVGSERRDGPAGGAQGHRCALTLPPLILLFGLVLVTSRTSAADNWSLFRGSPGAEGVAAGPLPDKLELLWKKTFKDGMFEAAPAIVDGVIYIGALDGYFRALDLATGSERWKYHSELGFKASAAVREGRVYVGDCDGKFHCLDAATGKLLWGHTTDAEINAGANFYKDKILCASQDGSLYCLAADGKLVWKYTIDNMLQCSPAVIENRAFLAGCDGKLHIVDLDTGKAAATVEISDPTGSTPACLGDFAYFGTQGATFLCVDWKQAKIVWSWQPRRKSPIQSAAALADGLVIFGGRDRIVHALDAKSGTETWSFPAQSQVDCSPVVVGKRVYIGGGNGRLFALDVKTGDKLWEYEAGGGFTASPGVAAGRLVIGNDDGDLLCFGAK